MLEVMIMDTEQLHDKAAHAHPWRRFFARGLDLSIYQILWSCIQYFVFRWHPQNGFFVTMFISYIVLGLMMFIEPLLLSTWGSTPGKAILGLVVRNGDGSRLSYSEGLVRTFGVFADGYGYGIPIYNIVRGVKSYSACQRGETMEWDVELDYQVKDARGSRVVIMVAANAGVFGLALLIALQSQMPMHRGELTPVMYAANVNDVISRPNVISYGRRMTETGEWVRDERDPGTTVYHFFDGPPPDHHLTIENGIVTGTSFTVESTSNAWKHSYVSQKFAMAMAFLGAQEEVTVFTLRSISKELAVALNEPGSYSREIAGVRIVNNVEHRGYTEAGTWLFPKEGEEQYFHMVFSMEIIR